MIFQSFLLFGINPAIKLRLQAKSRKKIVFDCGLGESRSIINEWKHSISYPNHAEVLRELANNFEILGITAATALKD